MRAGFVPDDLRQGILRGRFVQTKKYQQEIAQDLFPTFCGKKFDGQNHLPTVLKRRPFGREFVPLEIHLKNCYHFAMKIYLATGNIGKKREFQEILRGFDVVIPRDEKIEFEPEETGETFYENSMIKARELWKIVRAPVIADDSGLCVDALGGAPGIFSSRYAGSDFMRGLPDGKKISQDEQNRLLLEQVSAAIKSGIDASLFPNGPRSCRYACSMVLLFSPERFFIAQETMEGALVESLALARGEGGFGYDPIVELPCMGGRTVAQLSPEEKNSISHRGKASRAVVSQLAASFS